MVAHQDDWGDDQGAALHGAFDDSESRTHDDACRLADGRACTRTHVYRTGVANSYWWQTEGANVDGQADMCVRHSYHS